MTIAGGSTPRTEFSERLVALDVFRGATIAAMLLVNDPGSWSHVYPPFLHAEWHGWTFTDLIFPFFLFIVGITTHLSLSLKRESGVDEAAIVIKSLRRGGTIILLGLLLSSFPFYAWWALPGIDDPSLLDRVFYRFAHMRFPGVLQRIGVAYIGATLLTLRTTLRQQIGIIVSILIGYWLAMTLVPVPGTGKIGAYLLDEPEKVLSAWIDRQVFGPHLWAQTKTWDPEGLLSTLPAIATVMFGILAGRLLRGTAPIAERLNRLFVFGSIGAATGLAWHWFFPINKSLWTSSYVVFTAGVAALVLATTIWLVDVRGSKRWTPPFVAFGINPMLAFVGSGLMARLIYSLIKVPWEGQSVPLQAALHRGLFASWLPPKVASLAFAIAFVLLWLGILWPLYRKRLVLRV